MKTYVINLERSPERKIYMQRILKEIPLLEPEFVTAVDGRALTKTEREALFDIEKFRRRYSVYPRVGEIGCTLSHQKCYQKIVENKEPFVLILEDDIVQPVDITQILKDVAKYIQTDEPRIILLSGWYWYHGSSFFTNGYKLADVYDAFLTHAYLINYSAAKILIDDRPYVIADDWGFIRKKGIKLLAILPHLIDQNLNNTMVSTINIEQVEKRNFRWRLKNLFRLVWLKVLYFIGRFEEGVSSK